MAWTVWKTLIQRRGRKLSDIEFLAIKEFDGKTRQVDGTRSATGTLATITAGASPNKDMYLSGAKVSVNHNNSSASISFGNTQVDLTINGTVVESARIESITTGGGTHSSTYEFNTKGVKVTTGQIILLNVQAINNSRETIAGVINVFEEDTGASPAV